MLYATGSQRTSRVPSRHTKEEVIISLYQGWDFHIGVGYGACNSATFLWPFLRIIWPEGNVEVFSPHRELMQPPWCSIRQMWHRSVEIIWNDGSDGKLDFGSDNNLGIHGMLFQVTGNLRFQCPPLRCTACTDIVPKRKKCKFRPGNTVWLMSLKINIHLLPHGLYILHGTFDNHVPLPWERNSQLEEC